MSDVSPLTDDTSEERRRASVVFRVFVVGRRAEHLAVLTRFPLRAQAEAAVIALTAMKPTLFSLARDWAIGFERFEIREEAKP